MSNQNGRQNWRPSTEHSFMARRADIILVASGKAGETSGRF
jgi:hypothetical protein